MMRQARTHHIGPLCRVLKVSRSGYYEWQQREESARLRSNRQLGVLIRSTFHASDETYGARRIQRDLQGQGHVAGKNRIARLMHLAGLRSVHRRKYRPQTTDSQHGHAVSPNIIHQDFTAKQPNQKWGCDISYVPTAAGWLYVAIVMDFYSRKIVGWSTGSSLATTLCCEALQKACLRRNPPQDLIHHSDRGVQYASEQYRNVLAAQQFVQSMSRKGNCWDNAMVESFFHTLKVERVHRQKYRTRAEARTDVQDYIERFYNNWRMHSALEYKCPTQYERDCPVAA